MADKVVVITGASSGIGEAVALLLAKRSYRLVLASRNMAALRMVAARCESLGAKVVVIKTDVSKTSGIQKLTETALHHFGNIDVWINNASIIFYSRFLDMQPDEFRKILDTNLYSAVEGSRAALTQFEHQGHGTLINISSSLGAVPAPYASSYVTSKFAVRGLSASLAQELALDDERDIHVCTVLPGTINTPVYQHSGNRMQHKVRAMPPVYSVEKAARKIAQLIEHPKQEIVIGKIVRPLNILYALMPRSFVRLFARYVRRYGLMDEANRAHDGNLYEPVADGAISGGWRKERHAI